MLKLQNVRFMTIAEELYSYNNMEKMVGEFGDRGTRGWI